ncbi:MAG TPA: hypothetical protein DCZ93_10760 [Elusimicrobia bacterium]|nr:hypothetical protein [Elusimicrobiota bacterium]
MKTKIMVIWTILFLSSVQIVKAIPQILNFQGRLTESETIVNGPKNLIFRIYDSQEGGAPIFSEEHVGDNAVVVSSGIVNVLIGGLSEGGIPQSVFGDAEKFIEIEVDGVVLPRQRMASAAYAFRSAVSNYAERASTATYAERAHYVDKETVVNITTMTAVSVNVTSITVMNIVISSATVEGVVKVGGGVKIGHSIILGPVDANGAENNIVFTNGDGVIKTAEPNPGILRMETAVDKDILIFPGKNLGVGTAVPWAKLDVNGTIRGTSLMTSGIVSADRYQISGATILRYPGSSNLFIGNLAGLNNTVGINNLFIGDNAGIGNADGNSNTFVGVQAGRTNSIGSNNTFVGTSAGAWTASGENNSMVGRYAGLYSQIGSANAVLGEEAGFGQPMNSFSSTTLLGYRAGYNLGRGDRNILIGFNAGDSLFDGASNIIIGYDQDALSASQSNFLNIGGVIYGDLAAKTIGVGRTAPQAAMDIVATGMTPAQMAQIWRDSSGVIIASVSATGVMKAVKFIGDGSALTGITVGDGLGDYKATQQLDMRTYAIWSSSSITASRYQIKGSTVLAILGGIGSLGVGLNAGNASTGWNNSFIGYEAGYNNTSGQDNTFVGYQAGYSNVNRFGNTFLGKAAGYNSNGFYNTAVGYNVGVALASGEYNVLLGKDAGSSIVSGSNNVIIGNNVGTLKPTDSYVLNIASAVYGDLDKFYVGIGSAAPNYRFVVSTGMGYSGNLLVISTGMSNVISMTGAGEIFANKYYGDGSSLTGIVTSGVVQADAGGAILTSDFGKTITINSDSPQTITLPSVDSSNVGAQVTVVKLGSGQLTIVAADNTYIHDSGPGGTIYNATEIYSTITLRLATAINWVVIGGNGSWTTTN